MGRDGEKLGALWEDGDRDTPTRHRCITADRGTGSCCAEGVVGALAVALPREMLSWTDGSSDADAGCSTSHDDGSWCRVRAYLNLNNGDRDRLIV